MRVVSSYSRVSQRVKSESFVESESEQSVVKSKRLSVIESVQ